MFLKTTLSVLTSHGALCEDPPLSGLSKNSIVMKRVFIGAFVVLALLSGCTNSPAHRIAECKKNGGTEASCTAAEWDYEKVNPLPQYDPNNYDNAAALQAAYNASVARTKASSQ